jgi:multiple antibiotic resistance protein
MAALSDFIPWVSVALITLLPIVNPFSTAFLLLAISAHLTNRERNRQVTWACIYMTVILLACLFGGHVIMVTFGISIPGIRIAGGLVIGYLGFRMLFPVEEEISSAGKHEAVHKSDISFSPLAMPSLSGPGAIAVVITMSSTIDGRHGMNRVVAYAATAVAVVLCAGISWVVLRGAVKMRGFLGVNGVSSISRVMGFLLICIGIQFVINGVRDLALDKAYWTSPPVVTRASTEVAHRVTA